MKVLHTIAFANAYFYYDENTLDAVIIDAGSEAEKLKSMIENNKLNLKAIVLTHGHYDHIGAVNELKAMTGAPVIAGHLEDDLLKNPNYNASLGMIRKPVTVEADKLVNEGYSIEVGGGKLKVIHTPGHTLGGISLYDEENHMVFVGDTLFYGSIGRSDLPTGNTEDLYKAIKTKLYTLPDDVIVYTGHGQATTIGHEKNHNPFVNMKE